MKLPEVLRYFWMRIEIMSSSDTPQMQEQQNVDLIKRFYTAFGKGDVDTIINSLADQLVWRFDAPSLIPYAGQYKTPTQVREGFFGSLVSTQKDYALETDEFIGQDDKVIMVGKYGATVNATGKRFEVPLVHVWTMQDGKVNRFILFTDTARVAEAYSVEGVAPPLTWIP
jgi:uncharacterized protein